MLMEIGDIIAAVDEEGEHKAKIIYVDNANKHYIVNLLDNNKVITVNMAGRKI